MQYITPTDGRRPLLSGVVVVSLALFFGHAGCAGSDEGASGEPADAGGGAVADVIDAGAVDTGPVPDCTANSDCKQPAEACVRAVCSKGKCIAEQLSGSACDDGDDCTADDRCAAGKCKAGPNTCACVQDADCGKFDDGDKCSGTLYCDTSKVPYSCVPTPNSAVHCPTDADTACSKNACMPQTGDCQMAAVGAGSPCVDDDPCTVDSACKAGKCVGGAASWCACQQDKDCAKQEDGDLCNGTLYCDKTGFPYTCKVNAATVVKCQA